MKEEHARKYSKVKNYPEVATEVIKEMHRQVGNLKLNSEGVAYRGVLVRHLVLPNYVSDSFEVVDFLSTLGENTAVNIMGQYLPYYKAVEYPEIARPVYPWEVERVKEYARQKGLWLIED
jgi:putative pyruvate formate lyase activating enzyme